ncbi:MAG: formyltransferase family protein [Xanthobacteraceae bacterium]
MTGVRRRVLLFTSQDIGFQFADYLATRRDIELLVIADRTARDDAYGYRSAIDVCERESIPCIRTARVDDAIVAQVRAFEPDLMMTVYFPHIVPQIVQDVSKVKPVNIHPGILPHYRGRYPTPWYILNGAKEFGIAIHRLDGGVDTGDVLVQERFRLDETATGHALYRQTMDLGAQLLIKHFDALIDDRIPAQPQAGGGSYYSRIEPRYHVDWNLSRETIARRVRVHAKPYFPAFSYLFNRLISINRVAAIDPPGYSAQGGGRIVAVGADGALTVSCSDGCLRLEEYEVCPSWAPGEFERVARVGARFE